MSQPSFDLGASDLGARLDRAIAEAEKEVRTRQEQARAARSEREQIIEELRTLHDQVLRLSSREGALPTELLAKADLQIQRLVDELARVCGTDMPTASPTEVTVSLPASMMGEVTRVEASVPPDAMETVIDRIPESVLSPTDHVHEILDGVYQEILTLEENADHFPREELHARVDLLLARLRDIQDGPLGEGLDTEARHFMTTRFGLLGSLQKRYQLGFLSPLNRGYSTDWPDYIERLECRVTPLSERLEELRRDRDREVARRRAAQEHAARRKKEGEELLDELRLFLCAPEVSSPARLPALRQLVAECISCLGADHRPLVGLLEAHQECFEGREFKALRRNFKRVERDDDSTAPQAPAEPSIQADREADLEGAYAGRAGLVLGGLRREKAETLLRSHLGLAELEWIPAQEITTTGPAVAEARLVQRGNALVILLEESLGDALAARLVVAAQDHALARVPRGQTLELILKAVPTPEEAPTQDGGPRTVNEAIERAVAEHPQALICAWNSASDPRDYPFQDARSVYRALVFLATTYRDARAGRAPCPDLDHALREACGFSYRPHQSACTVGQFPEAYGTTFDGTRHELHEHVGKGAGRDPRHSIRLAFTWLPERDAVLLGFIGQHQPTRAS